MLALFAAARGRFLLLLFALFAQDGFAPQANLVAFDREHFHQDLVALFQLVATSRMRWSAISLMCRSPSVPGKISTKAPNSARRTTLPR